LTIAPKPIPPTPAELSTSHTQSPEQASIFNFDCALYGIDQSLGLLGFLFCLQIHSGLESCADICILYLFVGTHYACCTAHAGIFRGKCRPEIGVPVLGLAFTKSPSENKK
jgi:hypothetical protein